MWATDPPTHLVGCFSHELLGGHLPDGRDRDHPSHIGVVKVAACLVTQLLKEHSFSRSQDRNTKHSTSFALDRLLKENLTS